MSAHGACGAERRKPGRALERLSRQMRLDRSGSTTGAARARRGPRPRGRGSLSGAASRSPSRARRRPARPRGGAAEYLSRPPRPGHRQTYSNPIGLDTGNRIRSRAAGSLTLRLMYRPDARNRRIAKAPAATGGALLRPPKRAWLSPNAGRRRRDPATRQCVGITPTAGSYRRSLAATRSVATAAMKAWVTTRTADRCARQ